MESIMKKVLFVLICSVFLLSVTAIRAEGGHADRVIEEAREALQKIAPDLEQSTEEFFDGTQYVLPEMLKPTAADYAGAFKVVRKNGYFVGAYRANGDFSFLQSTDGEYWLIPLSYGKEEPSGSIQFVEENGKMTFTGGGRLTDPDYFPFSYERLAESVNRSELIREEIEEFQVVQNLKYRAYYAYLRSGKDEFIIPLDSVLSEAGLQKDTVYTADDFIRKIDMYYDEEADARIFQEAVANGEYLYGGGVLTRAEARRMQGDSAASVQTALSAAKTSESGMKLWPGIIAVFAISGAVTVLLRSEKKLNQNQLL